MVKYCSRKRGRNHSIYRINMNTNITSTNRNRIIPTVSHYAKEHLLYVQEIGTLTSKSPHVSTRNNIYSFLFLVVINGSGHFTYRGETILLHSGDCVFIDCHEPYSHESSAKDPWTLNWVHFYGNEMGSLYKRYINNGCSYLFHPAQISDILDTLRLLYSVNENVTSTTEIMSNKYLTDIVAASFMENESGHEQNNSTIDKIKNIREYMIANYSSHITLERLAEEFYISKFHLAREYKKVYGTTLIADLTAIRISQSKAMLRFTNDPIDKISNDCGFSDSGYFIKVFGKSEGMTPLTYRKKW